MRLGAQTTQEEHESFRARLEEIKALADSIGEIPVEEVQPRVAEVHDFLADSVMPHAVAEGVVLFPIVRHETCEPTIGVRMTSATSSSVGSWTSSGAWSWRCRRIRRWPSNASSAASSTASTPS